jgi:phosphonate transport system substrate-binding protein
VLSGVANGAYEAGGTIARVLDSAPAPVAASLRVLASTPEYRPHPFAVHPRVPAATLKKLRAAFLSLEQDAAGRALLEQVAFKGIEPARDKDYDSIRRLDMRALIESVQ